jgi:cysteine desulfurase
MSGKQTGCKTKVDLRAPTASALRRALAEPAGAAPRAASPRRIDLDNAATTRVHPDVIEAMAGTMRKGAGNPSSLHAAGREARKALEDARAAIARHLHAAPREIVFTSGGTEADNLAFFGAARAHRTKGAHVVISAIEHAAVHAAAKALMDEGIAITWVGVDAEGRVSPDAVERSLRPDTILASVMLVNNETGVVQPVAEIARRVRSRGIRMHVDAVQAFGKMAIDAGALGADLLAVSAHKIHGPPGVGALYVRQGVPLHPRQVGGHQEWAVRPGTENVAGVVGFAAAADRAHRKLAERVAALRALRDRLERGLQERVAEVHVYGQEAERSPAILLVGFAGVNGESLLIALDRLGVCVSTGSACATGSAEPSRVLAAMGVPPDTAREAVRFSVADDTTEAEIDEAIACVAQAVAQLRAAGGETRTPA